MFMLINVIISLLIFEWSTAQFSYYPIDCRKVKLSLEQLILLYEKVLHIL